MTSSSDFMVKSQIMEKGQLSQFLKSLAEEYTVFMPQKENDTINFLPMKEPEDIILDFYNSVQSPKHLWFPQTETLLKAIQGDDIKIQMPSNADKKAIFGIRPCDARAITILDKLFLDEPIDNYYADKRKNTLTVGLACNDPHRNCFCTSLDCGPHATDGMDILLTDIGEKFYIEVFSEKGSQAMEKMSLSNVSDADKADKERLKNEANSLITEELDIGKMKNNIDNMFEDEYWQTVADKCVSCGACTYLCPTCHCFDITDVDYGNKAKRQRTWDACQFQSFTIHSSGHNPRANKKNRMRNRIFHKYSYYPAKFDDVLCTGCGRCITCCSGNVNLKQIIKDVGGAGNE